MTIPTQLDGNAIGGVLYELFGREMTHRRQCCGRCGAIRPLASLILYRGPGNVLRCPQCGTVLMVTVATPTGTRLTFGALRWLEMEVGVDDS